MTTVRRSFTALDSDDDDGDVDGYTGMKFRHGGGKYISPVRAPSKTKPPLPPSDLDPIAETPLEEDANDQGGEGGGEQEDSEEEIARAGMAKKKEPKFDWDDDGKRGDRELKLAMAVHSERAYDCPKGSTEARWRRVVKTLKGSKDEPSVLFKRLGDDVTMSWRTLQIHWKDVYAAWEKGEKIEHKTSGAAATYGDTERIYTTIQTDMKNGMGKRKPAKNSFARESLDSLQDVIDGAVKGSALKRAAQRVFDEAEEAGSGDSDDDGKITPQKKARKVAKERQGRGQGKNNKSDAQAQQSNLSDVGMLKVKLDGEAQVRQHQLEERRMLLEERKMELEERREARMAEDKKMEREQMLMMLQVTKAMADKIQK